MTPSPPSGTDAPACCVGGEPTPGRRKWLRAETNADLAAGDTRRAQAQLSSADDDESEQRLDDSIQRLVDEVDSSRLGLSSTVA